MNYRWLCFCSIFFISCLLTSSAVADSPIDKEDVLTQDFDDLMANAQQAFSESNYEAALEYLVVANRLEPDPRLFLNIARSYEELGECHIGLVYYEAFLKNPPDDPALIERAENSLADQAPQCSAYHEDLGGRLRLDSEPLGATVYIDDSVMGVTPTETAGMEPGNYTIRFELEGYDDDIQDIEIVPNDEISVRGRLQEESDEPDEEPDETVDDAPAFTEDEGTELNVIALGMAGAGAVGLITGAVFDMVRIPGIDEDRQAAFDAGDRALYDSLSDSRDSYVTIAVISYVAGAALFAAGAGWFAYDMYSASGGDDDDIYGWQLTPELGDDRAGVLLFRRF